MTAAALAVLLRRLAEALEPKPAVSKREPQPNDFSL